MISSNVVLTLDRLEREIERFGNEGVVTYDVETIPSALGADDRGVPSHNQTLWMGMAAKGRTIQVPMGHPIGTKIIGEAKEPRVFKDGKTRMFRVPVYEKAPEQLTRADAFPLFNKLFEDPNVIKVAHGATFDAASVAKYRGGQIPAGKLACSLVTRWLTDENRKRYGLKWITRDIYKFVYDDEEVGKQVEKYPFNQVAHYLHCDVKYSWLEYQRNMQVIHEQGLDELFELETQLVSTLAHMRTIGVRIDTARLETLREELSVRVEEVEKQVWQAAGKKFNLNAARQKQEILWGPKDRGGQGLKPWKLTDGGREKVEAAKKAGRTIVPDHTFYSTDEESLESFKGNAVVDTLLEYQETSKVLSTYVYGYLGMEGDKEKPNRIFDGKIYPDFVQYGAATGRFSCRAPNLQNVPAPRTDLGKLVRGLFIADPGWKLIVADYGQVELVILAHLAGEGKLFEGFHQGIDPHTMTAAMVLGKDPAAVTKDERQRFGKSLNFAVVYGAGVGKVASMAGISKPQAKALLAKYAEMFPEVGRLRQRTLREARRHSLTKTGFPPHSETILGRKRRLPSLNSADEGLRAYSERQAFNARIQGSSADLTKLAMNRYMERKQDNWQLLLTVHDELVTTAPADEAEHAASVLIESMTGAGIRELLTVPLTADLAIVDNWADAKD